MQKPTITQLPKSRVELVFTITPEDAKPYIDQAVTDISSQRPIKGFRPGKATYDDVKRAYGEMLIWETALERIVRASYVKAVIDEQIETVGSPEISVEKLVPNQDITFKVIANVVPQVTKLADYDKPLVEQKAKPITDETVDKALVELRTMRRIEVVANRTANDDDMALIDLEIKKDGVVVEGGVSRNYKVYLNEPQYIPGFADQLIGAKKDDVKTFVLDFPKDHYNKQLAGHPTEFVATIKDIYELQVPEANDEFAKSVGLESLDKLKELLRNNLEKEETQRSLDSAELELLQKLIKESRFTEIPDLLVSEEVRRMMMELEHSLEERGGNMADYLSSIKKTADDLRLELVPRAIERVQTAVLIKEIAKRENIEVLDPEVEMEQDRLLATIDQNDKKTREMIASPEYHDYIKTQTKNRKTLEVLKKKAIKGYAKEDVTE